MNGGLERALGGERLAVDHAAIEASLAALWREEGRGAGSAVMRAALWNVIAWARRESDRRGAAEVLARVSSAVPQRTILVSAEPGGAARLDSWISANCHLVGGDRQMCSEEITIVAGGARVRDVGSLVRALLLPDMPVALWWIGDPPDQREALEVVESADRLVFDSARVGGPADLDRALALIRNAPRGGADLQWMRIEEWRRATAALFDCPGLRDRGGAVRAVRIRHAATPERRWGESAGAWLFAGWLAAQLRLPAGADRVPIRVEAEDAGRGGALISIEIDLGEGVGALVERSDGAVRATPRGTRAAAPAVIRLFSSDPDHLVRRALARGERNAVYERALAAAAALARSS